MKIRDIMVGDVQVAEADDTLDEVAIMMRDQDVGAIPVVDEEELIGIITDRDIVVRCIAEGKDPSEVAADEAISSDLQTIDPEADVEEARRMMSDYQVRRLPVVDHGRLVGMVSLGDLAVKTDKQQDVAATLEDISDGVKASGEQARPKAGQRASKPSARRQAIGGRQEVLEETGRHQPTARGRIEEQSQGRVDRTQLVGDEEQGISNQSAGREIRRQERIVPIRTEEKDEGHKGQKNRPPSKRKAG